MCFLCCLTKVGRYESEMKTLQDINASLSTNERQMAAKVLHIIEILIASISSELRKAYCNRTNSFD